MARATAAGRRGQANETDALRPLLELLGEADAEREFQPGVAFAGGTVVLRRRDGGPVPATFGTLEELAALRARGQVAEVAPRVFRITAAGRQALAAGGSEPRGRGAGGARGPRPGGERGALPWSALPGWGAPAARAPPTPR